MHDDRDLDSILDKALASYSDAEPDPALHARIVATAEETGAHWRRILSPAAAFLAAALFIVIFLSHTTAPTPTKPTAAPLIANTSAPAVAAPAPITVATHHYAGTTRHRHLLAAKMVARRDVFPTPTPLTAEENTLLRFANEHPEQARHVLAAPIPRPVETEPLTVAPVRIAALSEPQAPKLLVP